MNMLKTILAGAVTAVAVMGAGPASADYIYNVTFNGAGVSGSVQLVTSSALDGLGGYDILSLTGTENGDAMSLLGGQPGNQVATSPEGAFFYDNAFFPHSTLVDDNGILFAVASLPGTEGNIYFDGSTYWFYLYSPQLGYYVATAITIAAAQVPEPVSIALFGSGLLAAGWAARRRKKAARSDGSPMGGA